MHRRLASCYLIKTYTLLKFESTVSSFGNQILELRTTSRSSQTNHKTSFSFFLCDNECRVFYKCTHYSEISTDRDGSGSHGARVFNTILLPTSPVQGGHRRLTPNQRCLCPVGEMGRFSEPKCASHARATGISCRDHDARISSRGCEDVRLFRRCVDHEIWIFKKCCYEATCHRAFVSSS